MHSLPRAILESKQELKKWATILKMGKKFPKNFLICSRHFQERDILTSLIHKRKYLVKGAIPCRNLPKSSHCTNEVKNNSTRRQRLLARSDKYVEIQMESTLDDWLEEQAAISFQRGIFSAGVQTEENKEDKSTQANLKVYLDITSLWDTESKLFTMTGIPTREILNTMISTFKIIRPKENCTMDVKSRICLTIIKTNCYFAELAILFQITEKTAKRYFADTIQLLAKIMKNLIYWQSRKENLKSMPKYFRKYSNVRTILDCTEVKTVTSCCLSCRIATYSHYKSTHTLKVLIGVSPFGAVNYVSKFVTGKSSDKAIFRITDLLSKLEPGDSVMVDKGFMIADELAAAGIQMIRPDFLFENFSKCQVQKNTEIAAARVHVERRIARIKQMKVFSEKICSSVVPYINDIMTVVCALSNLSTPILNDNQFI